MHNPRACIAGKAVETMVGVGDHAHVPAHMPGQLAEATAAEGAASVVCQAAALEACARLCSRHLQPSIPPGCPVRTLSPLTRSICLSGRSTHSLANLLTHLLTRTSTPLACSLAAWMQSQALDTQLCLLGPLREHHWVCCIALSLAFKVEQRFLQLLAHSQLAHKACSACQHHSNSFWQLLHQRYQR